MASCMEHSVVMERLDRDDKRLEGHDDLIKEVTDGLRDMAVSLERTSTLQQAMQETMAAAIADSKADREKQAERVSAVELQPAHSWHELKGYLLSAAIGALFGAMPQLITLIR